MAEIVVTLRIMPESPESDLVHIEKEARAAIKKFGGEVGKKEIAPFAFGLNSLTLYFVMEEAKGSTEDLENVIAKINDVSSVEVVDVRRTVG